VTCTGIDFLDGESAKRIGIHASHFDLAESVSVYGLFNGKEDGW